MRLLDRRSAVGCCGHSRRGSGILIGHICRSGEWRGSGRPFVCIDCTGRYIDELNFLFGDLHELERSRLRAASIGAGVVSGL